MSHLGQRQFEVLAGAKSPFLPREDPSKKNLPKGIKNGAKKGSEKKKKGPSGSTWNELHLNWLHVLCESGYDLKDVFSRESELSQSGKIATSLRESLDGEWGWICANDHELSNSIFARLQALVLRREEADAFNTHSNTQSSTQHFTPPSAKSQSVTPQQYPRGTQDLLRERGSPSLFPPHKWGLDPQLHMPQPQSRKRQREEIMSPRRERDGPMIPPRQLESAPTYHNMGGSPAPRQQTTSHQQQISPTTSRHMPPLSSPITCRPQDPKTPSHEIQSQTTPGRHMPPVSSPIICRPQDPKTPSHEIQNQTTPGRHMPPLSSPLTHRQQDPKTPSREIQSQTTPSLYKPPPKQSSITWQQDPNTPCRKVEIQTTRGGQKAPPKNWSETQGLGASSTVASQHRGSQSATYDEERDGDEEKDDEQDREEEGNDEEENDEEENDEEENDEEGNDGEDEEDEEDDMEEEDAGGASEAASFDKSEKDVEAAGLTFLSLVHDAINKTKKGVEAKRVAEQNLKVTVMDPRPHRIKIDGVDMSTHPDLVLELVFGKKKQRKRIGVVLEFKKRDHKLNDEEILAQEVSELLGAVLEKKAARKQKSYKSYLISWHGLKGYISRFYATREYLNQLQENSRGLQDLDPPRVRRSEEFDLTKSEERINFAIGCARIAVEELLKFERNQTSGLLERVRA